MKCKRILTGLLCLALICTCLTPVMAAGALKAPPDHVPLASNELDAIYAIDQENQTYHPVGFEDWEQVRSVLTLPRVPQTQNTESPYVAGFCFIKANGSQVIYTVSTTQVLVGNTPLMASVTARAKAEQLAKELCKKYPAHPAMLAYMNPNLITRVTFSGYGTRNRRLDTSKYIQLDITRSANPQDVAEFAELMKNLEVTPNDTNILTRKVAPLTTDDVMQSSIEFSSGVRYHMTFTEGGMSIRSTKGERTLEYTFPDYDARRAGTGQGFALRNSMWSLYNNSGNYDQAAIFLTKPNTGTRTKGAFYSMYDGGLNTMTRLGQILDRIRTATPLSQIYPSTHSYLEIRAQGVYGVETFELDEDTMTAYYNDGSGRKGRSVKLSETDYNYVESLLNGKERSNLTLYLECDNGDSMFYTCDKTDSLVGELFDTLPKDPAYSPYNAGPLPSYAKDGIHCWGDNGGMTKTTVYPKVMVQESNMLPWTPAKTDAAKLYRELTNMLQNI